MFVTIVIVLGLGRIDFSNRLQIDDHGLPAGVQIVNGVLGHGLLVNIVIEDGRLALASDSGGPFLTTAARQPHVLQVEEYVDDLGGFDNVRVIFELHYFNMSSLARFHFVVSRFGLVAARVSRRSTEYSLTV